MRKKHVRIQLIKRATSNMMNGVQMSYPLCVLLVL
jgi:hypothetical protein